MTRKPDQSWIKSTCAYCGVGCGIEAKPLANGLLQVRGDKHHPANFGQLCSKGLALGETVTTDGKLTTPTIHGQTSDWQQSLKLVADTFNRTIAEHGPDSVAFYVSGQLLTEDYYLANKLMKGFIGSGNIDTNSRLCMSSSVAGHKRAFGSDTVAGCYEDIEHAELIVLTGSNLAWCHPVLFQRIKKRKQKQPNLKVVVIDPRATATCEIADLHLALKPGTDVKLFNGLLQYLASQNKLDYDYIHQYTQGFEQALIAASEDAPTQKETSTHTDLEPQKLKHFFDWFANTEKVMTFYSQGVNQSSQGTDKVNAIINCHLATGKIGKVGSCPFSITGQPNAMGGREVGGLANTLASHMEFGNPSHHQLISDYWQTESLATQPGLKAVELFEAIEQGKIKALWIMATNPATSLPDSAQVKRALEACPFVVVSDCIEQTDTCQLADVLLPAQGWAEKSGTVTNSERRISRQRRLIATQGEAKPDWWIISKVAQKMGFQSAFTYQHEAEIFSEYCKMSTLGTSTCQPRDLDLSGLQKISISDYINMTPQQWPLKQYQPDIVHQRMFSDGQFFTDTGKAQFVAVCSQAPKSQPTENFPWVLNTGRHRDQWHTMTRTGLSPTLSNFQTEPCLLVNPKDANKLNLNTDDIARVTSQTGELTLRVICSHSVAEKQLFSPIHWSNTTSSQGKVCLAISANAVDSISGQPEFKHTPVCIEKVQFCSEALILTPEIIHTDGLDYWVKQTVPQGFLYRVASHLSIEALADLVQPRLNPKPKPLHPSDSSSASPTYSNTDPKPAVCSQLSYQAKGVGFREVSLVHGKVSSGFVVANKIDFEQMNWFESVLMQPLGVDISQSLYQGKAVGDLAQGKLICACKQVRKNVILKAIQQEEAPNLSTITRITQAGSGCGGCLSDIDQLLAEHSLVS
ncbi:nitrate reductase [Shewanella gelidii]|uniref:Nitrate reductase n=1 Tax=Shewanella gelidii TaxID=1642821 RepID=A0A917JXU1_9GAMM|nr:nitrate reductase [Shewanella gelidii]MCL1099373.1 nitrate reductase [Shewanella gelidii]GGI91285.1 nitrate reductase [Shewanella gelidii]